MSLDHLPNIRGTKIGAKSGVFHAEYDLIRFSWKLFFFYVASDPGTVGFVVF